MDSSNSKKFCVAGVDYSAAAPPKGPNATWLAVGTYEDGRLTINRLENIGSAALLVNLKQLAKDCEQEKLDLAVGLDFPFSVPVEAAEIILAPVLGMGSGSGLGSGSASNSNSNSNSNSTSTSTSLSHSSSNSNWFTLAATVAAMPYARMEEIAAAARLKAGKEPRRLTDNQSDPRAQSPLHKINPGMLKMTWQGMAQLSELTKYGFDILPFAHLGSAPKTKGGQKPLVMEVYPAAILKLCGLPHQKYKGKSPEAQALRQEILEALGANIGANTNRSQKPNQEPIKETKKSPKLRSVNEAIKFPDSLSIPAPIAALALDSDDALDAILAALGTALAQLTPSGPETNSNLCRPDCAAEAAKAHAVRRIAIEGWIYVPPGAIH